MMTENTHLGTERISGIIKNCRGVFFIGIGGINMSSLAHLTHLSGIRTGGSDRTRSALTERLEGEGIEISYTHSADNIAGYDVIVYTVAIPPENPEYAAAMSAGLPCISRADYMGYLMSGYKKRVGISGMHGKSTCTSMCARIFMDANADPTVLSGAELASMGGAYRVGGREHFIFEACEYRDSFLDFRPNIAVILNIEPEHLDYFTCIGQIKDSFVMFASLVGADGYLIANADDANVLEVVSRANVKAVTFGVGNPAANIRAINILQEGAGCSFDIISDGEFMCHVRLAIPGVHNIYNALAAAAVAKECGIEAEDIAKGLSAFTGARRRMELMGKLNGAEVYNDYAHHPTEIRATLDGVRRMGGGAIICVFQPHTYSRTAALFDDFASSFDNADRVIVADIYAARGTDDCGVSSKKLARAIGEKAEYIGDMAAIARFLCDNVYPDDKVVVMGAGDIDKLFSMLELDKQV